MNNIEILEMQLKKIKDFCKELKDNNKHYYVEDLPYYMFWNGKQAKIVENLIKENKELKELENLTNESIKNSNFIKKNYIPKSKVKEIIYPTPENPISFEVQSSEMYKKLEKLIEGE